jgi:hypothetical protein
MQYYGYYDECDVHAFLVKMYSYTAVYNVVTCTRSC